jgi:hypothetical protein
MTGITHRRFAGMLEFDRNGPPWEGTPEQQTAIRGSVSRHAIYGSRLRRALHALDQAVNREGKHFIPVSFVDLASENKLGFCFPTIILLHEGLLPSHIEQTFWHELGHLFGWKTPAWSHRSEDAANYFGEWATGGQPDGDVWDRLAAVVGSN